MPIKCYYTMATPSSKKRTYLTLKQKVKVIKYAEKNPSVKLRSLAQMFDCGRTQVSTILKDKDSLIEIYESNAPGSRVHMCKNFRVSEYDDINKALYEWFRVMVSKNVYATGPLLIDKAKEIATKLGKPNLKGSQGWLGKWKQRYNIKQVRVSGESADVSGRH